MKDLYINIVQLNEQRYKVEIGLDDVLTVYEKTDGDPFGFIDQQIEGVLANNQIKSIQITAKSGINGYLERFFPKTVVGLAGKMPILSMNLGLK